MNEVIIAAIAAWLGSVITIIGKVIVDIIRAKKEPDELDLELKDELQREKEKNDEATAKSLDIQSLDDLFEDIDKELVQELLNRQFSNMNQTDLF